LIHSEFVEEQTMRNILTLLGLGLLTVVAAMAQQPPAPEIDPGSVAVPLALLGGATMIIRSRIR
jgi:hypothetical protein